MALEGDEILVILVAVVVAVAFTVVYYRARLKSWKADYDTQKAKETQKMIEERLRSSKSTMIGQIAEQLVLLLPDFTSRYLPADAYFLGKPVDYIIFKNLSTLESSEPKPLEIVFLEVKTGNQGLAPRQKAVRDAVDGKFVKFETLKLREL